MLENASHWLRSVVSSYSARCTPGLECEQQAHVGEVLQHILCMPAHQCARECCSCVPMRQLQLHFVQCQDAGCVLCAPVREQAVFGSHMGTDGAAQQEADIELASASAACEDEEDVGLHSSSCSDSAWSEDEADDEDDQHDDDLAGAGMQGQRHLLDAPPAPSCPHAAAKPQLATAAAWPAAAACSGCSAWGPASNSGTEQLLQFMYMLVHSLLGWAGQGAQPHGQAGGGSWLAAGRQLWVHLLQDCSRSTLTGVCAYPGCQQARRVLLHVLTCEAGPSCPLCGPLALHCTPGCPDLVLGPSSRSSSRSSSSSYKSSDSSSGSPHVQLPAAGFADEGWLQAVEAAAQQLQALCS